MVELLIPFGISNKTDQIIEPDDAERGRACDCRCPGCDTPLLSRHPKDQDRRVHFAHDSRHPEAVKSVFENCPFNSKLAIALMARHVAEQLKGSKIQFPQLFTYVAHDHCHLEGCVRVTKESQPTIEDAIPEVNVFGPVYDLMLVFGDHSVLVWLEYKDRPRPGFMEGLQHDLSQTGILCIKVDSFNQSAFARTKERFSDAVIQFVLVDGEREWLYHPRTNNAVAKYKRQFCRYCRTNLLKPKDAAVIEYFCEACGRYWEEAWKSKVECPDGCGHKSVYKYG